MNPNTNINIVAASDNHYAILLAALIKSIEENHKTAEKLDFYIIDDGITEQNRQKIQASSNPEMATLHWFKTAEVIPPNIKIPTDKSAFPITTYLRLFAPYIIPQDAERFIYFDVDMIVLEDVSKLWHTDIGDHMFAAVTDLGPTIGRQWGGVPNWKELGLNPDSAYFNAGLMMINPVKWRAADISNKVIQCIIDNDKHVNFADQYGLNVVLVDKWFVLDKRWNGFSVRNLPDPFVIHFLDIKPIFKSYNGSEIYRDEFYKYLRLTPWKDYKPVSDYKRVIRKAMIKLKKLPARLFRPKK